MGKSTTDKKNKLAKLDTKKQDDIKEKTYITSQVDTSITILNTPEDDVVLESLLFLSKYADIQINNLTYLQQHGLLTKLLNLFNRNICILRLSVRLISILVKIPDIIFEMDQDMYDDKIIELSNMYIFHSDVYVKEYCLLILSKLAACCRITCLIFKVDLFQPIFETIKTTQNMNLLDSTLELLYILISAPAALSILPDMENFEMSTIMTLLDSPVQKISDLAFEIIRKLTYFGLEVFQKMFRELKLIEKMFEVIMNTEKVEYHQKALSIILNCIKCEETSSYFIKSMEFLKFCQWVKVCDQDYLLPCVTIFEHLSKMPFIKQLLFDLSVEDSILYFLRSMDKDVLNMTCEAISNMSVHKYCCERMLTPIVLKELVQILRGDPQNEPALKTIFNFSRRNFNTFDMLCNIGAQDVLGHYFKNGLAILSEESFLRVLEMLYKLSLHPLYQDTVVSEPFFEQLLNLFQTSTDAVSTLACEILTNFVKSRLFRKVFLSNNGPHMFVEELNKVNSPRRFKNILIFILANLVNEKILISFLQNKLVTTLKKLPDSIQAQAPLISRLLLLTYNLHLPLKFFETNKLDITDKLGNKFYIIGGPLRGNFPLLELLEAEGYCTISIIYVVDYSYEVVKGTDDEDTLTSGSVLSSSIRSSQASSVSILSSDSSVQSPFDINYGKLTADQFLPKYINHVKKYLCTEEKMENKIKILAEYVNTLLCGPKEEYTVAQKLHNFKLHIETLKSKLGTSMIPIGFLRIGFHCERALLFKAIADRTCIPTSLVKGNSKLYWNEVALFDPDNNDNILRTYVVDLMFNAGQLLMVGSRLANQYCDLKS